MKLTVRYILAFLAATAVVSAILFGLFLFFVAGISFVTWSLPVVPIPWWLVLRICVITGATVGVYFICTKEGQDWPKEFANETNSN